MAKKSFKNLGETAAAQFISIQNEAANRPNEVLDTHDMHDIRDTQNIKDTNSLQKGRGAVGEYYRFNLKTPIEYKLFLDEAAWRSRKTVTKYINDLIKAEMEKEI